MILQAGVQLSKYDQARWVLATPQGRHFLINEATSQLCQVLKESTNYVEAHHKFIKISKVSIELKIFETLVQEKLGGYGILTEDAVALKSPPPKFLKWRLQLISAKFAGILATPFQWFFTPSLFWGLFSAFFMINVFSGAIILFQSYHQSYTLSFGQVMALFALSNVFHEVGHIAAARTFGAKHGGMGVGIFWIFPVTYADISGIWVLEKKQRIIANLGGIFNELGYAAVLAICGWLTNSIPLKSIAAVISIQSLMQLNPFMRHDGYWVLSDLTNTPNLMSKALLQARLLGQSIRQQSKKPIKFWLLGYGIINSYFLWAYLYFILTQHQEAIIHFPKQTLLLFQNWMKGDFLFGRNEQIYFLVLMFYMTAGRLLWRYILKIWHKIKIGKANKGITS